MSRADLISELRASRGWCLTWAIVALVLCALWFLIAAAGWIEFSLGLLHLPEAPTRWMEILRAGMMIQLSLVAFASPIPFINLLRHANSLGQLREGDEAGLLRALELNRTFWRQTCWLAWGVAWLLVYLFGGGMLGMLIWGK